MGRSTVMAPDGRMWRVGRCWFGERIRLRNKDDGSLEPGDLSDGPSVGDFLAIDDVTPAGIVAGLALAIAAAFAVLVVWPVVVIAVELVILLVVAAVGIAGRILFKRPWTVEARSAAPTPQRREWKVVGWRRSGELIEEISRGLEQGREIPSGNQDQLHVRG